MGKLTRGCVESQVAKGNACGRAGKVERQCGSQGSILDVAGLKRGGGGEAGACCPARMHQTTVRQAPSKCEKLAPLDLQNKQGVSKAELESCGLRGRGAAWWGGGGGEGCLNCSVSCMLLTYPRPAPRQNPTCTEIALPTHPTPACPPDRLPARPPARWAPAAPLQT